jgi:hypothetical protein
VDGFRRVVGTQRRRADAGDRSVGVFLSYDDKDQHFNLGPNTYLFGE